MGERSGNNKQIYSAAPRKGLDLPYTFTLKQTVGDFIDTATTSLLNARKDVGNGEYKRTWTKEDAEEILIAQV